VVLITSTLALVCHGELERSDVRSTRIKNVDGKGLMKLRRRLRVGDVDE